MSSDTNRPDEFEDERFDPAAGGADYETGSPRKRSGSKVLWIILAVVGGSMLLCCGGGVFIYQKFKNQFKMNIDMTAAGTEAMTKTIADIEILEGFQPQSSLDMAFIVGSMKWVVYQQQAGTGRLMLAEMNIPNADQAQQKKQMEDSMLQQQQQQGFRILKNQTTETREFTIRGEKVEFVFAEGTDVNTDTAVRQVTGVFPGREGMGYLMLQIDDESYDEQAVVRMIESIK
jgi:hypothetical protein